MKRNNLLIALLSLVLISSCSFLDKKDDEAPKLKRITGRVYYMGGEEITSIGLNAFSGTSYPLIASKEVLDEIFKLNNSILTVRGYIDPAIKYPLKSIHVEDYVKHELTSFTGKIHKTGKIGLADYYLQTKEKSYKVLTDKIVEVNNNLTVSVEISGYVFSDDDDHESIYMINLIKKDGK